MYRQESSGETGLLALILTIPGTLGRSRRWVCQEVQTGGLFTFVGQLFQGGDLETADVSRGVRWISPHEGHPPTEPPPPLGPGKR